MANWTLEHAGTTQTLAAWGFSGCVLTDRGWVPGTFQFTHAGVSFDAAPIFAKDDVITLFRDGVIVFTGFIVQTPAHTGEGDDQTYTAENVLGDFSRRVFGQMWQNLSGGIITDGIMSRAVLFDDGGGTQSVALALAAIVNAAAAAGVAVQMGTAVNLTVSPRKIDIKGMSFLEVLRAACVYSPDVVPQVDYTTTPVTLNFIRRGDAAAHDMPVRGKAENFQIEPLYDQQIAGAYIAYETSGMSDGKKFIALSYDIYPPGTEASGRRVLFSSQSLQGAMQGMAAQTTAQTITTEAVSEDDIEWWKTRVPYLLDANAEATLTDVTVTKDEDGSDTTVAKELRSGVIYPWMGGTTKVVRIKGIFNGLINGNPVLNQSITVRLVSTTLGSGDYTNTVQPAPTESSPEELPPSGVAEHMYSALGPLQWRGSYEQLEAACSANIRAGDVANFTGTANEAWSTARAQIQEVELNIDTGTTRIAFGRPEYLAPQDYTELLRDQRKLSDGNSSGTKNSGESSAANLTSEGPAWSPDTSFVLGAPEVVHPWKITQVGLTGNLFRVEGGTYDGVALAAQTSDIGSTRPLYIYITCEWTVTTWADRFAASVARTGEPAFGSSNSTTAGTTVIPAGVTTVKALLGVIAAGDIISQFENANLLPIWQDNGAMDGSALLEG